MSMNIQTVDQLKSYLLSNKFDLSKYKYKKENNEYGIEGKDPLQNPYLWNHIMNFKLINAIDFLINYKDEWVTTEIVIAIFTGKPDVRVKDCNLNRKDIIRLLNILKKNVTKEKFTTDLESIILSVIDQDSATERIIQILLLYAKNHEIEFNKNGNFMKEIIPQVVKTGNKDIVEMVIGYYPDSIQKSDHWGYLNALKKGFYEIAVYLLQHGSDYHTKKDLGYKIIERNDKNGIVPFGKNKEAHDFLMDLYRGRAFI